MAKLNEIQKKVLNFLSKSPLAENFYFTGGTLLAVFYLYHRKSKDLDFLSDNPVVHSEIIEFINGLKKSLIYKK